MTYNSLAIAVAIFFSMSLTGCYSNVTAMSPAAPVVFNTAKVDDSLKPAARLKVGLNGLSDGKLIDYIKPLIENKIIKSGIFSISKAPSVYSDSDTALIDLTIKRDNDYGGAFGQLKQLLVAFTLGLAAPVLPSTIKYDSMYEAKVSWPDGRVRHYGSFCSTSVLATLGVVELSNRQASDSEIERCLPMLLNEIAQDLVIYESAASFERSRRMEEEKNKVNEYMASCKSLGFKQGSSGLNECIKELEK